MSVAQMMKKLGAHHAHVSAAGGAVYKDGGSMAARMSFEDRCVRDSIGTLAGKRKRKRRRK